MLDIDGAGVRSLNRLGGRKTRMSWKLTNGSHGKYSGSYYTSYSSGIIDHLELITIRDVAWAVTLV